jgi:hypothetical protein
MPELRALLSDMEAKSVPEEVQINCCGAIVLRCGDVLHVPAGCLLVEKSLNDMDISIRLLGRHCPDESNASLRMVADQARQRWIELSVRLLSLHLP